MKILTLSNQERSMIARGSPAGFATIASRGKWRFPVHLQLVEETLWKAIKGEHRNIIVTLPPRHGKSELISKYFPAWFLSSYPEKKVLLASYGAGIARKWGGRAKTEFTAMKDIFKIKVSQMFQSSGDWETENGGGMLTAGVEGQFTGHGGDLLILDDIIKNYQQARSDTYRNNAWEWWQSTAKTRVEPGGITVIMFTRWHKDDLVGRLKKNEQENWLEISLPAIAIDENDLLGRHIGQALWPERWPLEALLEIKKGMSLYWWNSLYQQNPSGEEGAIFKKQWLKFYQTPPDKFDLLIHSWDFSFKKTEKSSFVVGQVWGLSGSNKHLIYQIRERADFVRMIQLVLDTITKFPRYDAILIEDKASGPAVVSTLKDKISGIIEIEPKGSKEERAFSTTPQFESGNVFFPEVFNGKKDFVDEIENFPNVEHNDQVDTMTQALLYLKSKEDFSFNFHDVLTKKEKKYISMTTDKKIKSMR